MKRLFATILIIAMMATSMNLTVTTENVKAAGFEITSPTNNQIKAAGFFDIKWNSVANAKNYKLYVDGKLYKTTPDTQCEYYSTLVFYHKAYVTAELNDGTTQTTPTISFGISKKGLAIEDGMGAKVVDPSWYKASWYYNWGRGEFSTSNHKGYDKIEYVPMVWGDKTASAINSKMQSAINKGYKYMLTFNEPDFTNQANMSVSTAISLWPNFMNKGLRISSPSTALWPNASTAWFQPFMKQINAKADLNVDFITVHCYPDNFQGSGMAKWFLREVVDKTWEMYKKPIWITEFSTSGSSITELGTKQFIDTLLPELDKREYVERYSFFSFDRRTFNGGLYYYSTGAFSTAGESYAVLGNPTQDYQTYLASLNKPATDDTNTTTAKKPKRATIKSLKNVKGKKVKVTIKKISKVTGYKVRWADNKKMNGYEEKTIKKNVVTLKGFSKGDKCFVKACAYKKTSTGKLWGKWSKVKSVKIKK